MFDIKFLSSIEAVDVYLGHRTFKETSFLPSSKVWTPYIILMVSTFAFSPNSQPILPTYQQVVEK